MLGPLEKALLFAEQELVEGSLKLLGVLFAPPPGELAPGRRQGDGHASDSRVYCCSWPCSKRLVMEASDVLICKKPLCTRFLSLTTKRVLTNTSVSHSPVLVSQIACEAGPGTLSCQWYWREVTGIPTGCFSSAVGPSKSRCQMYRQGQSHTGGWFVSADGGTSSSEPNPQHSGGHRLVSCCC